MTHVNANDARRRKHRKAGVPAICAPQMKRSSPGMTWLALRWGALATLLAKCPEASGYFNKQSLRTQSFFLVVFIILDIL